MRPKPRHAEPPAAASRCGGARRAGRALCVSRERLEREIRALKAEAAEVGKKEPAKSGSLEDW